MWRDVRAELRVQVRRPAHGLLLLVAAVLSLTFGYAVPYLAYRGGTTGFASAPRALAPLLTEGVAGAAIGGLPIFVGALALVFGVLVVGSDETWDTWKTVFGQQPSRARVYAGKMAVLVTGAAALVTALFLADGLAALAVTVVEGEPVGWPALDAAALAFAGGWASALMWTTMGAVLVLALRGVPLAVGLGLVWMLAIQNLITGVAAPLLEVVDRLQAYLPGPNVGSLVAALGARPGTPGVDTVVGSTHAWLVVAGYTVVFTTVGAWLLQRRELT